MVHATRGSIVLAVLLILTFPLPAQDKGDQKPATGREMDKMILDWPDFTKWFSERSKDLEDAVNPAKLLAAITPKELDLYLAKKGWKTDRFLYVLGVCSSGTMIAYYQSQMPGVAEQFDEAIEQMKSNPDIPEAEKKEQIDAFGQAKAAALGLDDSASITKEDLALVQERLDALMKMFGATQ